MHGIDKEDCSAQCLNWVKEINKMLGEDCGNAFYRDHLAQRVAEFFFSLSKRGKERSACT